MGGQAHTPGWDSGSGQPSRSLPVAESRGPGAGRRRGEDRPQADTVQQDQSVSWEPQLRGRRFTFRLFAWELKSH